VKRGREEDSEMKRERKSRVEWIYVERKGKKKGNGERRCREKWGDCRKGNPKEKVRATVFHRFTMMD
jgi:hypothetical protein